MKRTVADVFIETLLNAGARRIYGVAGDSPYDLTDWIRTTEGIDWLHVGYEEVATFAAGARSRCPWAATVLAILI